MPIYNPPPSSGGGTPASPDTSFQFNDGGAFGGSADAVFINATGQSQFGQPTEEGFRVEVEGILTPANCSGSPDPCSDFLDATECNGQSGCVSNMDNCSQFTTEQDCANYQGQCTTNTVDCADFTSGSACNGQTGCTAVFGGDCNEFDGNEGACVSHEGCSYDPEGDPHTCTGSYFTACDGGVVFSSCSGMFFVDCTGTPDACDTFLNQGDCTGQGGCIWTSDVKKGTRSVGVNKWETDFTPTDFSDLSQVAVILENTDTTTGATAEAFTFGNVYKAGRIVDKDGNTDFRVGSYQVMRLNASGHVVIGGTTEPAPGGVSPLLSVDGASDVKAVINVNTLNGFSAFVLSGSGNTGTPYFEAQARFSNTASSNTFGFNFNRDSGPTFVGIINMNGAGQVNLSSSFSGWLTLHAGGTAASSAPFKAISASLMTSAEVGAFEFLTDRFTLTGTTGTTRKDIADFVYRGISGARTLDGSDELINCTSGTFAVTLPTAVGFTKQYVIKNSGTGVITLNTTSSQTIDGNASGVLTLAQYASYTLRSNNANWILI